MNRFFTVMALLLSLAISNVSMAGDHWNECSSADGNIRLSNGMLTVGDSKEEIEFTGKMKILKTISKEKTMCTLKDSGKKVLLMQNIVTVEQITVSSVEEIVLCQRGGGNLVPEEFCKE